MAHDHPVLAHCAAFPALDVGTGHLLIEEGVHAGKLFVLEAGAVDVVRNGVRVVTIDEPGAFVGEISALLGSPPTANVVAATASRVRVIQDAGSAIRRDPVLLHAISSLLARRLQAVTAYLVDIKRQYAATDTHLALMDEVLAHLMTMQARPAEAQRPGSERTDVPDY